MQEELQRPKVCQRMRNILLYLNMNTILRCRISHNKKTFILCGISVKNENKFSDLLFALNMRSFLWCLHPDFLKLSKTYPRISMVFQRNFLLQNMHLTVSDDIEYSCQVLSFSSHTCMVCVCAMICASYAVFIT